MKISRGFEGGTGETGGVGAGIIKDLSGLFLHRGLRMRITIESTNKIVTLTPAEPAHGQAGVACRVWEGQTDGGLTVVCFITRIMAQTEQDLVQFENDLRDQRPSTTDVESVLCRMII